MSGKKENKLGMRASDTSDVILQNCHVSRDQLLGAEGAGFIDAMRVLDAGRIGIDAARLLTYRAAQAQEQGEPITLASAMAKLFASEMAVRVAEDCVQIHGGYGFVKDDPAEKYFRDVKLTTIGEGTSEIQRLIIARHLVRAATAA